MKKPLLFFAAICSVGLVAAILWPRKEVRISDFNWAVHGNEVTFTYRLANATDRRLTAIVTVVAEVMGAAESGANRNLAVVGQKVIETELRPKEEKAMTGSIDLSNPEAPPSDFPVT